MAISKEYAAHLEDLFSVVPDASIRAMFGGIGVFRHGVMFALATGEGKLAFKADGETIPGFKKERCEEWTYEHKSRKRTSMGYWYAPERLLDDPDEFRRWALAAFDAAARADAKKPAKQRKLKG